MTLPLAIHTIHWDEVSLDAAFWTASRGRLVAVWGAPFNADACMQAAGFADFGDSDYRWDDEFRSICAALLSILGQSGPPILVSGELPQAYPGPFKRLQRLLGFRSAESHADPTLTDLMIASACSDEIPQCIIDFGNPQLASVRVMDGHEILWIHLMNAAPSIDEILQTIAGPRPTVHTRLDWKHLAGGSHHASSESRV
jgi:hypothetical protein